MRVDCPGHHNGTWACFFFFARTLETLVEDLHAERYFKIVYVLRFVQRGLNLETDMVSEKKNSDLCPVNMGFRCKVWAHCVEV